MADEEKIQDDPVGTDGREGGSLDALIWGFHAIRKHWALVLAAVLLFAGGALAFSKTMPKLYEASTLVEFDPDVIRPMGNKTDPMMGWSAVWDTKEYYETQYRIIQSDSVLSAVVRNLGLQSDADFLGHRPSGPATIESTVAELRTRLTVEPAKGTRLVMLKVQDTKPAQARRLSEAIARAYINQNLEKMVNATGDSVTWLAERLDEKKRELEQTENSLHEFKRVNELPSSTLEDLSKMIRSEMQDYNSALTHTKLRRQELQARHDELSKVSTETPEEVPASELLANVFLGELRKNYLDATRQRAELIAEGKGLNHPLVRRTDENVALTKKALVDEIHTVQGAVARDLAIIRKQEAGEEGLYEESRKKGVELNQKELDFHRLDRMRAQDEKLYAVLLEQLKEADLRRMEKTNNIRIVDLPNEPKFAVSPRLGMNVGIGLLVGLVLGIVLALLREALDNTLKTPEHLEKRLNVTFLGLLPEIADDDGQPTKNGRRKKARRLKTELPPELLVHERPASGIAEAARALRTNLMFMNPDKPYRRLLVTSAAPAEGKTTVAVSIAISLAQGGQRVCIVDCDLRRPRLHRIFDRAGDIGLMNAVVGEATLDEVAKPTIVPNLYCIPCGPIPPNSADVVSSERFRHLLDELSTKFDRIILDSPPLVAVTDSAILSTLVDGTILVVRAFKTTFGLAKSGLRGLRDVDAPIAGAVLNAVNLDRHEYAYQYYYYRREGYAPPQHGDSGHASGGAPAAPPPN